MVPSMSAPYEAHVESKYALAGPKGQSPPPCSCFVHTLVNVPKGHLGEDPESCACPDSNAFAGRCYFTMHGAPPWL